MVGIAETPEKEPSRRAVGTIQTIEADPLGLQAALDPEIFLCPYIPKDRVPDWVLSFVRNASNQGEAALERLTGDPETCLGVFGDLQLAIDPPPFVHEILTADCLLGITPAFLEAVRGLARAKDLQALAQQISDVQARLCENAARPPGLPFFFGTEAAERPMESPQLPLSIVVTSRNDDHGGRLLHRMQVFLNGLLDQAARHRLRCELIIVEWNPPQDRPKLAAALEFPAAHDYCSVRVIEVPARLHGCYQYAAGLPLYQMIAKNVGIRRALGRHVLVTNIDILFSEPLFAFLAAGDFATKALYRVDRHDVDPDIALSESSSDLLEFCQAHVLRMNERFATRDAEGRVLQHIHRDEEGALEPEITPLHTNACGDFQLIARDDWFALRGYPEFDGFSLHIDSLFEHAAHHSGVEEAVLPPDHITYHIDHDSGWSPQASATGSLDKSLERRKVVRMSYTDLAHSIRIMKRKRSGLIFNPADWGLACEALPEQQLLKAAVGGGFAPLPREPQPQVPDLGRRSEGEDQRQRFRWEFMSLCLSFILQNLHAGRTDEARDLYLWGVGPKGRMLGAHFLQEGVPVAAFIDSDPAQRTEPVFARPVLDPAVLLEKEGADRPFVLVGSTFHDEIRAALHGAGYAEARDYYAPF